MEFRRVKDIVKLEVAGKAKLKGSRVDSLYNLKEVNKFSKQGFIGSESILMKIKFLVLSKTQLLL
jgi:hypothetical protein